MAEVQVVSRVARHRGEAGQIAYPWRATVRTVFQAFVALCALAPVMWLAATGVDATQAAGWAAVLLAVAGGVTRVMALPGVEEFLVRFVPWLAAAPPGE